MLWEKMKDATIREVKITYKRMGVDFDSWNGEAFYEDKMQPIIDELREKGISKVDHGAQIVDLSEWNMPPCIIVKSDGSTIYATRDLAAACYRKATYDFTKLLYVVAYQQDLHFKQFFKVLELMGRDWVKDCVHVNFGMVSMEGGSFSTRGGKVLYLDDVLDAAVEKTYDIICEKSPDLADKKSAAEAVGVGAILWSVLYNSRIKDVTFSWDKVLNFDGETAPYVQYTHARSCSVLRKAGERPQEYDASLLSDPESTALLKAIAAFPEAVRSAAEKYEPYVVARAVMQIANAFNRFYYEQRIMADDPAIRAARLALCDAARQTLKNGLNLLGLAAPERM
jgi:arginyl-tRNA synthetase